MYRLSVGALILILLCGCITSKESLPIAGEKKINRYCELKKFTAQSVNGKIYINWLVNTNVNNYYFLLERSTDGENFITVCIKKGFVSPVRDGLLYSYTDTDSKAFIHTYRLRAVQAIKNGNEKILYTDSKNLFKDFENALIKTVYNNTVKK
ncbi:MAG: hypothetical protein ACT4ON_04005 [Bacteroidota bacterium]